MTDGNRSLIPDRFRDLLDAPILAHLATIGPDGAPQNNPVWFAWCDGRLTIGMEATAQKVRNLRRDPRLSVSLVDPDNPGRYLEIRGRVIEFDRDPEGRRLRSIVRKYTGDDDFRGAADNRLVVVIEPLRTSHMG